jgi:Tfp pilus assembly protein PilX
MPNTAQERGSAIVTAMLVMMLFLITGMAILALVDTQQRQSGDERRRESTFQLTEGVLNTQIYLLSRQWPGIGAPAFPQCSPTNQSDSRCPDTDLLASTFKNVDSKQGISWTTVVRDNTKPTAQNYFDDQYVMQQPAYDANNDGYLWVKASGNLKGRQRAIVALVRAEELTSDFPRAAVVAGGLEIQPSGHQPYIDTNGQPDGEAGRVILRCPNPPNAACAKWISSKGQIGPQTPEGIQTWPPALSPEKIQALRERALANNTYYGPGGHGGCPATLEGALVFIESATGCPAYNPPGKSAYNAPPAAPGVLVIGSGSITINGNATYYGIVYNVNGSDGVGSSLDCASATTYAVDLQGGAKVIGAVVVDGCGRIHVGNNSGGSKFDGNIVYDPNARNALKTFGTAGIVQNSFREIQATN